MIDLSGAWTLRSGSESLPATVPGCVHTDLLSAGRLVDPFLGENEKAVAWVGRRDWTYEREISWDGEKPERIELVFEGLDTVADIWLGDVKLGSTRNMHRSYRFDVTALITDEPQTLRVHFTSAYTEAERVRAELGERPNAYPEPFNFIRKMACSFGWDWGPTLVTSGIWRPVRLEGWSTARLREVRALTTYRDGVGLIDVDATLDRTDERELQVKVLLDGREVGAEVPGIEPWNPRAPRLHDIAVVLLDGDTELDRWERRVGFRSVEIDTTDGAFLFRVNGEPVLVKGVNWIPDDIFPSRMTRERYAERLGAAAAAGVNLIRVWGGGIYESRDFYEVCDELGLMVWQDFLFACACYPEEEPIRSEVIAEARENVVRLSSHPSLVAWNGNNENLWLYRASGWDKQPGGSLTWGSDYYLSVLPAIMTELDPSRPYMAGSPWSGSWELEPNSPEAGTFHSWEVWNRQDYLHYRDSTPRFVAEFGWQAPPAWRTLRDAVADDPLLPDSPGVLHHQKAEDGNGKLARGLAAHFPAPRSTEAWHYLTQLNQVRAVRTGIEHWRSHWPHTAGTILWQLNDLWPVTSWAAIDGAGRRKPLYHELRRLYAPRALTIQPRDGGLVVAVMNDSPETWTGIVHAGAASLEVEVEPRSVSILPLEGEGFLLGGKGFLVAELDGVRALWFADDYSLDDPQLTVAADVVPGGLDVHVHAAGLARDILLQPDRIHPAATVSQGFVTLLPGESTTLCVRAPVPLDAGVVKAPWVLTDLASVLRS
ncbi:glycoside hydrolase family 2 protein [Symbioplanes lichenis]|uniref:glycoside hydrolase family 2 protein n=1 Tax=Symbioplanes lichenis TaxID=1629072 RepID=UPI00273A3AFE|nr:glycoside hydrolase family 2 protein [Actinoplanes lichenis]